MTNQTLAVTEQNTAPLDLPDGARISLLKNQTLISGNAYALRGPLLSVNLIWPSIAAWSFDELLKFAGQDIRIEKERCESLLAPGFSIDVFLELVLQVEQNLQMPIFEAGCKTARRQLKSGEYCWELLFPTFNTAFTSSVVHWLTRRINAIHLPVSEQQNKHSMEVEANREFEKACASIRTKTPQGINPRRILQAAAELKLPYRWLPNHFMLIGSGRYGRILNSTISEVTPSVGVHLARSKTMTASLLRQSGLPAPKHFLVSSEDGAIKAAQHLGYPVVVKPENLDGGTGVFAGLEDPEQVRKYFIAARKFSKKILVEKHVRGRDYRITVCNGQVVKSILRIPGGVTGDGQSSISRLIDLVIANAPPNRPRKSLLSLDEEATDILTKKGMTPESVPHEGEFIPLRLRANISSGGSSEDVLSRMHPDNVSLAIRACKAMRLDIAGIDLLIPDIAVSWMASESAICEVNAQPQISTEFAPNLYLDMLSQMIPSPARLKVILLLDFGEARDVIDRTVANIASSLSAQGESVFLVRSDGQWLERERLSADVSDIHACAVASIFNRDASAVVMSLPIDLLHRHGLPWDQINQLFIIGIHAFDSQALGSLHKALRMTNAHVLEKVMLSKELADQLPKAFMNGLGLANKLGAYQIHSQ